jgi:hypothetical protein
MTWYNTPVKYEEIQEEKSGEEEEQAEPEDEEG